jgi:hypothetical protein
MDGINPTLAFAALFFGLSGNAHHATQDHSMSVEVSGEADCPALVVSADSQQPQNLESWTEALQDSLASAYALPGMTEPALGDTALAKDQSDPIARRMLPVAATNAPIADPATEPCAGPAR